MRSNNQTKKEKKKFKPKKKICGDRFFAEHIINHIKKTFTTGNDIAKSLRLLEETYVSIWKLTLHYEENPLQRMQSNKQYKIDDKAELEELINMTTQLPYAEIGACFQQ